MTEIMDSLRMADRVSGLMSAALLLGVLFGFFRAALGHAGGKLRALSAGICIFAIVAIVECLRVRGLHTWDYPVLGRLLGIAINVASGFAAYCVLHFLWLTIPEEINGRPERANWTWYTSPLYPPWGIPTEWREALRRRR